MDNCFLKVLIWRRTAWIFQMGKMLKRRHLPSACQTPRSLSLTPPRTSAHPPRTSARPHSHRPHPRSSSLPLSTRRNWRRHPPPATQPLPPPPSWSAACQRSGGCPTLAWTRASSVSPGRRMAASSTGEPDTSFPATSAPGSWRRGTNCVRCAGCRYSRSSSPTSAEAGRDCPRQPLTTDLTRVIVATVTQESVSHLSALFPLEDGKGLSPVTENNDQLYLKRQIRLDQWGSLIQKHQFGTIFSGGFTQLVAADVCRSHDSEEIFVAFSFWDC